MLRRSNSASHIPVPRTLFGRETGITSGMRRAQSSTRLSQKDQQPSMPKKPKRTESLERKSSFSTRLSKLTPLNIGRGRNSLRTTPGSSAMSQRSRGSKESETYFCHPLKNLIA
ncbi:hypothetical protein JTB14_006522 [Gonioctena quinquepunctata]|nr:hypothetical protein JTB14_006522 [Gonioctena quinquepunctata]